MACALRMATSLVAASPSACWFAVASPFACFVAGASPKACGGPVRRFGGAVGAERADFPSVLGLAAPSRNSLRARWALRSDKRDESVYERASRWAASPAPSAPHRRAAPGPHTPWATSFWFAVAFTRCASSAAIRNGRRCAQAAAKLLGWRAEGQDSPSLHQSVAAGAARWGRFGGLPRNGVGEAVRAAHFVL